MLLLANTGIPAVSPVVSAVKFTQTIKKYSTNIPTYYEGRCHMDERSLETRLSENANINSYKTSATTQHLLNLG